jgi:hypothetical protein
MIKYFYLPWEGPMNATLEVIANRRSVRAYRDQPVMVMVIAAAVPFILNALW